MNPLKPLLKYIKEAKYHYTEGNTHANANAYGKYEACKKWAQAMYDSKHFRGGSCDVMDTWDEILELCEVKR